MKKFAQKNCQKMFLEAIFSHLRKLSSEFRYKIRISQSESSNFFMCIIKEKTSVYFTVKLSLREISNV